MKNWNLVAVLTVVLQLSLVLTAWAACKDGTHDAVVTGSLGRLESDGWEVMQPYFVTEASSRKWILYTESSFFGPVDGIDSDVEEANADRTIGGYVGGQVRVTGCAGNDESVPYLTQIANVEKI